MVELFERAYSDEISAKDGGFIFQAILNYDLGWAIVDGETSLDQKNIQGWLNQVDVFPDLKFDEGHATLTYVILSEVNLLKRKFELASEAIKRIISPEYAKEMEGGDSASQEEDSLDVPQPAAGDLSIGSDQLALPGSTSRQLALPEPQKQLGPGQRMLPEPQRQLPPATSESKINEVLYTTKLTSAQITANQGSSATGSSGLMLYYNFNDGTAGANNTAITSVVDQSGNNRNGTFYNTALTGITNNFVTSIVSGF